MQKNVKFVLSALVFVGVFALAFWLTRFVGDSEHVQALVSRYGYAGIFLVSIISGFNFVVPLPAVSFLPAFLAGGLEFFPAVVIMASGMTVADAAAYVLGRAGRNMIDGNRMTARMERFQEQKWWLPMLVLFLWSSFAPMPNELLIAPLGFLRYRLLYIIPAVLLGNIVFSIIYSHGITRLFEIL